MKNNPSKENIKLKSFEIQKKKKLNEYHFKYEEYICIWIHIYHHKKETDLLAQDEFNCFPY